MVGLLLGLGLAWSGLTTLRRPDRDGLPAGAGRARAALRVLGAVELVLGLGLLAGFELAGLAAAALGAGFLGYLTWAQTEASDRCGAAPVTWRSYAVAGLVVAGGLAADAGLWAAAAGLVVLVLVGEPWTPPARSAPPPTRGRGGGGI